MAEHEIDRAALSDLVARLRGGESVPFETQHRLTHDYVLASYGAFMHPRIRDLPLEQTIRAKDNLRGMGCDGGFDPIPPRQIEYDNSLKPLEVFTALLRAAIQFYAFSGPAQLTSETDPFTRWGFLHIDQTGAPHTHYLGLHQDMVRYLTDEVCRQLDIGIQTWMQRGDSAHIQQLLGRPGITRDLLLNAFFGEDFDKFVATINGPSNTNAFDQLGELSDQIDNARLCEFPADTILDHEGRYIGEVARIGA